MNHEDLIGMPHRKIAAAMGIPKSTVGEYLRGDHWT